MVQQSAVAGERVGKRKKKASKNQATHPGYAERDLTAPALCARLSTGRPYEVLLFESRRRGDNRTDILTALIDRRSGTLAFIGEATELGQAEANELRRLARDGFTRDDEERQTLPPPLAIVPTEVARIRLSRAILASRIGGLEIPAWVSQRAELVGDPTDPASRIDDIYLCFACDNPLPVGEQLARAARIGHRTRGAERPPVCPACRGEATAECKEGDLWLGRAWLMIAAGLPRRALVCAARAEASRARPERLDALRGAAMLALGDGQAAAPLLEKARAAGSLDHRVSGWLEALMVDAA